MTPEAPLQVGVVGAAGYAGGEALRLLHGHPWTEVAWATSDEHAGDPVSRVHPNLHGLTRDRFRGHDAPAEDPVDALLAAVPHGAAADRVGDWLSAAHRVVDMSADHRLDDPATYADAYGTKHPHPHRLGEAVYGVPELHREALRDAHLVAAPGCVASAATLALHPLADAEAVAEPVTIDAKVGSSAGGRTPDRAGQHAERRGVVRPYAPASHRHGAEVTQETGLDVRMTAHAVEMVRGVQVTCHVPLEEPLERRDAWRLYREAYDDEPFVRLRASSKGVHRFPEPKLLEGTNRCDVGFALDPEGDRLVVVAALDNLVKGAAGAAVQSLNVSVGWPEDLGLGFAGLHPN